MNDQLVQTDLSEASPHSALWDVARRHHWLLVPYRTEHLAGKMLLSFPETDPPQLTLSLGRSGWHRVWVGLWGGTYMRVAIRLRLSGERYFTEFTRERPDNMNLEEVLFTCGDLTGQDLVIAAAPTDIEATGSLAYVRCEPLSEQEVCQIKADRGREDTRRVIAYHDGHGLFWDRRITSAEQIQEAIEPYRHSDVESVFWGLSGDSTNYDSRVGQMYGAGLDDFRNPKDRVIAESVRDLTARGITPLVTSMEHAQQMGIKFHVYLRMGGFASLSLGDTATHAFFRQNPQWHCVDEQGIPIGRLSYAYPEVRRYVLDLLAEVAEFGVDGINLNFLRGPAFVMYEEPLVQGFQQEYGEDPRSLDEWDERWLRYRCCALTEFVRELRPELDGIGQRLGKRLEISATSFPTAEGNLFYGLDLETWIAEGLVDRLTPYGMSRAMHPTDLQYYTKLTQDTPCSFWPHLPVHRASLTAAEWRQRAVEYYEKGAEGLAIWDSDGMKARSTMWEVFHRLGHVEEMRAWLEREEPSMEPKVMPLERLGEIDLRVYSVPATQTERLYPEGVPCHLMWWAG